jgi:hypothetical protein
MAARAPLSPRRQALAWLCVPALALLLLEPSSREPGAPSPPVAPQVLLLPDSSSWVDRAELADPASLITPPIRLAAGSPEASLPEATPFPPSPPELRSRPDQGLSLPLAATIEPFSPPDPLGLPELAHPLRTLGERIPRALPPPSPPVCRVFNLGGQLVHERNLEGDNLHKYISLNDLSNNGPVVLGLGIDAFGLQARPVLLSSSGSPAWDQAVVAWAVLQPWASRLPPGAYRAEVRP